MSSEIVGGRARPGRLAVSLSGSGRGRSAMRMGRRALAGTLKALCPTSFTARTQYLYRTRGWTRRSSKRAYTVMPIRFRDEPFDDRQISYRSAPGTTSYVRRIEPR